MSRRLWIFAVVSILGVACVVTGFLLAQITLRSEASRTELPSYEDLTGSVFGVSPQDPFGPPGVREIALPRCLMGCASEGRPAGTGMGTSGSACPRILPEAAPRCFNSIRTPALGTT